MVNFHNPPTAYNIFGPIKPAAGVMNEYRIEAKTVNADPSWSDAEGIFTYELAMAAFWNYYPPECSSYLSSDDPCYIVHYPNQIVVKVNPA